MPESEILWRKTSDSILKVDLLTNQVWEKDNRKVFDT